MLSHTSERSLRLVRAALTLGWGMILLSLFWDPVTPPWTAPGSESFFALGPASTVQGHIFEESPYAIGARVFWTFVIPIVPIFLMVFGHETWRRLCPLSFLSQLPSYLGWQRKAPGGKRPRLLARDSFFHAHSWSIQFGLLFTALCLRLLLINSDRGLLAGFMLTVIAAAVIAGMLWGGKTWCHCFCPINIVQRMYSGPGGLLESSGRGQPKSMCRSPAPQGDAMKCVACVKSCSDIDLERSYAAQLTERESRFTYYGFVGLVVGFYLYYFLFAGSWDYYFSGDWTHEASQLESLFLPGFFWNGQAIAIPKIAAAPLTLLACVLASFGLGCGGEALYRTWRNRHGLPSTTAEIRHHCFSVSAYTAINIFYVFGGRPTILLMPPMITHVLDFLIVFLTTAWLMKCLRWSPSPSQVRTGQPNNPGADIQAAAE